MSQRWPSSFLCFISVRLLEMKRVLKPTGSIYIHCDHIANAYIRMAMDSIFGTKNLRREIIWSNGDQSGFKSKAQNWIRGHDTILYYTKNNRDFTFNKIRIPLDEKTIKRYDRTDCHGNKYKIYNEKDGTQRIAYLKNTGVALPDVWTDIPSFQKVNNTLEITGFPDQKPLALYQRIIFASSNPGDLVLDPFAGCATTPNSSPQPQSTMGCNRPPQRCSGTTS